MDPFIGEIRLFTGNYAPRDWLFCDGSVYNIVEFQALFAVIYNRYGGNGQTTFRVPDLRGRVPMQQGAAPGLTPRQVAQTGGDVAISLNESQMPAHTHAARCVFDFADTPNPSQGVWARGADPDNVATFWRLYNDKVADTEMNAAALSAVGSGTGHNNLQPFVCLNYIIAYDGVFPVKPS